MSLSVHIMNLSVGGKQSRVRSEIPREREDSGAPISAGADAHADRRHGIASTDFVIAHEGSVL